MSPGREVIFPGECLTQCTKTTAQSSQGAMGSKEFPLPPALCVRSTWNRTLHTLDFVCLGLDMQHSWETQW